MRYRNAVLVVMCVVLAGCGVTSEQAAVQAPTAANQQLDQPAPSSDTLASPTLPQVQDETVESTATASQQQNAAQPPACVFTGAAPAARQVPALDAYTFSTPRTVLEGKGIAISQWLPDNQRLLLTTDLPDGQGQSIATLDVQTGATEPYATRLPRLADKPVWLAAEQAVAFTQILPNLQIALKMAYGSQQQRAIEDVATTIESPFISADAEGTRIAVGSASDQPQPQVITTNAAQRQVTRLGAIDSGTPAQSLPKRVELEPWEAQRTAWSPDGQRSVVYNKHGATLVDVQTGTTCSLSWGNTDEGPRWALDVQWSPDGQSIAALTSVGGSVGQLPFTAMTVLDSNTGHLQAFNVGVQYIHEMGWLPNGQQLVALGDIASVRQDAQLKLILVDTQTGEYQIVLPDSTFRLGIFPIGDGGLAVASNGSKIAARCAPPPTADTNDVLVPARLCVIDVQASR